MNKKDTIFCVSEEDRKDFFNNNTNLIYIIRDLDDDNNCYFSLADDKSYFPVSEDWERLSDFNNSVMGYYQNGYHQGIQEIYEYVPGNGFLKRFDRNDKKWYRPILPVINNGDLLFIEITNYLSDVIEYEYYMGVVVKRKNEKRSIVFYNNGDYDILEDLLEDEDVNILVVDDKSSSFKNFGERLSLLYNNHLEINNFKFVSNDFNEAYWRFQKTKGN